jgi:hypothetical protein
MWTPRAQIFYIRSIATLTGVVLLIAALGIWTNYGVLREVIAADFILLALLSFALGYRDLGMTGVFLAILFNPFIPFVLTRNVWVILDIVAFVGIIYYTFWTTDPHWKGTRFEQYVSTLFPEPDFVVVDRTRDVSKFLSRKVESDSHPDFVFRNQKTGKTFAVECKWRRRWYPVKDIGGLGLWWDLYRGERYKAFGREQGVPVFVAFGIGGTPEKPAETLFFDINDLNRAILTQSEARNLSKSPNTLS